METAGNIAEAMAAAKATKAGVKVGQLTVVVSGEALLKPYPARMQATAKEVLEGLGVKLVFGARVTSPTVPVVSGPPSKFEVTLSTGEAIQDVACYLPSFAGKANTDWLASSVELNSAAGNRVVVDEFLRCPTNPKVYAIGGCADLKEAWLGVPKMEGQAKTLATNITAQLFQQTPKLTVHKEAAADMKQAPAVLIGRHTFAALVTEVMPPPMACMLKTCGLPFNLCCPCVLCCALCGPCNKDPCSVLMCCGAPCGGYPQGKPTANMMRELQLSQMFPKDAFGWTNIGKHAGAPESSGMTRS